MNWKYTLLLLTVLLLGCTFTGLAQSITIKGTVTDAQMGKTLPGANILVKGTTIGTTSDLNGKYEIVVPSQYDTLRFSYIGYQTKEVPIEGRSVINIALKPKTITGKKW